MKFNANSVCLEPSERWYLPNEYGSATSGYENLFELTWAMRGVYDEAVQYELELFDGEVAIHGDAEQAMYECSVVGREITYLAQKMLALDRVLLNYVDDGYEQDY